MRLARVLVIACAAAAAPAHAEAPRHAPTDLRALLQQPPAMPASPHQLSAQERAVLRRQLADYGRHPEPSPRPCQPATVCARSN